MIYLLFVLLIVGGTAFYFTSCKSKTTHTTDDNLQTKEKDTSKKVDPAHNPYNALRQLALNVETEEMRHFKTKYPEKIYGVVMDWDVGNGIATLVAFENGEASLYLSSGGGIAGGGAHANVRNSAVQFISLAQDYLGNTIKTDSETLPEKEGIKFYLLTSKGKFVAQEKMTNIENKTSVWLPLFEEGNKVISELRVISGE